MIPAHGPLYSMTVHRSDEIGGPTPLTLETEWVLANGLGGYAMGTVSGCATRRYHGLLVTAARPPVERVNTLAAVAETVRVGGEIYRLDCHEFSSADHHPGVFHPHGFQHLVKFEKEAGAVRWHYRVGPVTVVKELRLVWRKAAAMLTYRVEPAAAGKRIGPVTVEVAPLLAMRDFHQQRRPHWGDPFQVRVTNTGDAAGLLVEAEASMKLHLRGEGCLFSDRREWWRNFRHRKESERGQDDLEDLFSPGSFVKTFGNVTQPAELRIALSTDENGWEGEDGRAEHLRVLVQHIGEKSHTARLVAACDDFVVTRYVGDREFRTVIAGYPWFSDWGRDTMISLPGLMLLTGRFEEAGQTLVTYARHIRGGLVPNRFDDYGGEPHYNTVDASLWFIHAALEFRRLGGDGQVWGDVLAGACREVIAAYQQGTNGPIKMNGDGLIAAGDEQTQLTWMDAKRDGVAFTPRHGKCVEVNALWHRGLRGCAEAMRGDDPAVAREYEALAEQAASSFRETFWNERTQYLDDHVNLMGRDTSLRPNQVLAVSLGNGLLPGEQQRKVMAAVRQKLLTPMGLRTLPRDDPNYHGRHAGSMFERDRAYHQGTVWPWLIGPYVEGWLIAHDFSDEARSHTRLAVAPLLAELQRHSLGQLHEVFDGDEPHHPSGCIAQAWSVAELLRAVTMVEG